MQTSRQAPIFPLAPIIKPVELEGAALRAAAESFQARAEGRAVATASATVKGSSGIFRTTPDRGFEPAAPGQVFQLPEGVA